MDFLVSAFHASLTGEGYDKDDDDERAWLLTLLLVNGLRRYIANSISFCQCLNGPKTSGSVGK